MNENYDLLRVQQEKKEQTDNFKDIFDLVLKEMERQVELWGKQNHDPFKYLAILGEEVGECNKAAIESYDFRLHQWNKEELYNLREELVQAAAVACSIIDCLDRNTWANHGCGL